MAILTKKKILSLIDKKKLLLDPLSKETIGRASIDLTLDNKFRYFNKDVEQIDLTNDVDYRKYTTKIESEEYLLQPGDFVLAITKEKVMLPENICAWLEGRSRFARLGLSVHITASFLQPGINNNQVLEIFNASNKPLLLKAGTQICQLILQKTKGKAKYEGKFREQEL